MKQRSAFTLIEIAAVILIVLVLIGISLPLMNKGSSHHEAKLVAHSIQSLISLCGAMARSSGKVYFVDSDYNLSYPTVPDSLKLNDATKKRYRFSVLRIYSATWNPTTSAVEAKFCGESYDVPVSIAASYSFDTMPPTAATSDSIYFKPDGVVSSKVKDLLTCPENRYGLYYRIELDQKSGSTVLKNYKDDQ